MAQLHNPYKGEALETYNKIIGNMSGYSFNTVYKKIVVGSNNIPIFFYENSKCYLHILHIGKNPYTKKYVVYDYMLTKENTLKERGIIGGEFSSLNDIYAFLESLVGKNIKAL